MSLWGLITGRKERLRNKEDKLKRELDDLLKKPYTRYRNRRYSRVASQLREVREELANS